MMIAGHLAKSSATSAQVSCPCLPQDDAGKRPLANTESPECLVATGRRAASPLPMSTSFLPPELTAGSALCHCQHCSYSCSGQCLLDAHVKQWHGHVRKDERYKCKLCVFSNETKPREEKTTSARASKPATVRKYRCRDCGKSFIWQSHLNRHMRIHTGEKPYSCDSCGKAFRDYSHLVRHRRSHATEVVRQCEQCGARFTQVNHYLTHMKTHDIVRPHKCDMCPARFVKVKDLTRHKRVHTGERPYVCTHCQARFSRLSTMNNHVIRHHTRDYRHCCDRCGKGFINPSTLRRHVNACSA